MVPQHYLYSLDLATLIQGRLLLPANQLQEKQIVTDRRFATEPPSALFASAFQRMTIDSNRSRHS